VNGYYAELFNMTRTDYHRVYRSNNLYCALYRDGTLTCDSTIRVVDSLHLGVFDQLPFVSKRDATTMSRDTATSVIDLSPGQDQAVVNAGITAKGGFALITEGQVSFSGEVKRYRMGGHAMSPRRTGQRIIKIGTIVDGAVDAPFCGQQYYKPCATMKYAMSMIESIGPWIIFEFAGGNYRLTSPIVISSTGITIRATATTTPRLICSTCLVINAPSFKMVGMMLVADSSQTAVTVNSFDVHIINCRFLATRTTSSSRMIALLDDTSTTIVNASFRGYTSGDTAIVMTSSSLILKGSLFQRFQPVIVATSSYVNISDCKFIGGVAASVRNHISLIPTLLIRSR
jgi:hypothetical protein